MGCLSSRIDTKFMSCNTREHLTWLYSSISLGVWTVEREESKHLTAASMSCRARFERKNSRLWNRLDGFSFDFLGFARSIENGQNYEYRGRKVMEGMYKQQNGEDMERRRGRTIFNNSFSELLLMCSVISFTIKEFTWWEELFLEHPVVAVQSSSHTLQPSNCLSPGERYTLENGYLLNRMLTLPTSFKSMSMHTEMNATSQVFSE